MADRVAGHALAYCIVVGTFVADAACASEDVTRPILVLVVPSILVCLPALAETWRHHSGSFSTDPQSILVCIPC